MKTEIEQRRRPVKAGIVSGYFNPLHEGHLEYFKAAAELVDHLCVIVNNDRQVKIKGGAEFLNENTRFLIVDSLRVVDYTFLSVDKDGSVAKSIKKVQCNLTPPKKFVGRHTNWYFFNSGDRTTGGVTAEEVMCKKLGIIPVSLHLPKINSSSQIKSNG